MVVTACLVIELSAHFGVGTNIVTMAERTLGRAGKGLTVALYSFIYCATLTAYIAEAGRRAETPVPFVCSTNSRPTF